MATISFQTSCYQNSYKLLLKDGLLEHYLSLFPDTKFLEKTVIINNIRDKDSMEEVISLLNKNYPDVKYYIAYDEILNALPHFNLSAWDFPIGMFYSIQHFIGIYYTKADYLFHVSEDNNIDNLDSQFITDCIDILESSDDYISAQPWWGTDPTKGAVEEANAEGYTLDKFYICKTLSDVINIYKTKVFKQDIYHYEHPDSNKYPLKGGNSFERRVNSYMWTIGKYRAVHRNYNFLYAYYDNIIKGV
jgi:hypothetical protein